MALRRAQILAACSAALAAAQAPAKAQTIEAWHCTAPTGQFDTRMLDITGKTVISGRINMISGEFGSSWAALAKISVEDSMYDGDDCDCAGLSAKGLQGPNHVELSLLRGEERITLAQSAFGKPITFRIALDPKGRLTVQFGKTDPIEATVMLPHWQRDRLRLSCSGADVSFTDLEMH